MWPARLDRYVYLVVADSRWTIAFACWVGVLGLLFLLMEQRREQLRAERFRADLAAIRAQAQV